MEAKERGRKLQIDDFQMMVVLAQESNMRKAAERLLFHNLRLVNDYNLWRNNGE